MVLHLLRQPAANGRLEEVDECGHHRLVLGRLVLRGKKRGGEREGEGQQEGRGQVNRGGGTAGGEGRGREGDG